MPPKNSTSSSKKEQLQSFGPPHGSMTSSAFEQQLLLANKVQAQELYGLSARHKQLLMLLTCSAFSYFILGYKTISYLLLFIFCTGSLHTLTDGFSSSFVSKMVAKGRLLALSATGDSLSSPSSFAIAGYHQQPLNLYQPKVSASRQQQQQQQQNPAASPASSPTSGGGGNINDAFSRPIHHLYGSDTQYQSGVCRIIGPSASVSSPTATNQNAQQNLGVNLNNAGQTTTNYWSQNQQQPQQGDNIVVGPSPTSQQLQQQAQRSFVNNQSNFILQKTGLFSTGQPLWFRGGQQVDRFNDVPQMLNQLDRQGLYLNSDYQYQNNNNNNASNFSGDLIQNFFGGGSFLSKRDGKNYFVNGLQVSFSLFNKQASSTTQTDVAATFAALGIRDPHVATARVINWILSIMKKVAAEIVKSDKEVNGLLAGSGSDFRCALSLEEESPVASLAPPNTSSSNSGGWGSSSGSGGGSGGGWGSSGGSGGSGGGWGTSNTTTGKSGGGGGWGASTSSGGGGGWGTSSGSSGSTNTSSQNKPRKLDVLLQEQKRLETSGGSDPRTIQDTVKRVAIIDLRLQLDALLDVEGTFPPTIPSKAQDKSRRQSYVAQRVATLAASSGLAAFNFFGGDADRWSTALPSDPLIVVHILRHRAFRGMVRLAHEPAKERELSLCVGHTGVAPCFFVRYANPPEVPYREFHPAANSKEGLFHAVLMLIAIIAHKHRGSYGTLATGVVDLQQLKIANIV